MDSEKSVVGKMGHWGVEKWVVAKMALGKWAETVNGNSLEIL